MRGREWRASAPVRRPPAHAPCYHRRAMDIMGIRINTIVEDNVARRCDGCHEVIDGTPWRINLLDIVAAETPVSWAERPLMNPGPFQFHSRPCARPDAGWPPRAISSAAAAQVREIMRPVPIPGETVGWGLCDGIHRDDHEFVPA